MGDCNQTRLSSLCEQARCVLADSRRTSMGAASHVSTVKHTIIRDVRQAFVRRGQPAARPDGPHFASCLYNGLTIAVTHRILGFLHHIDCVAVSQTCRTLHEICLAHRPLWSPITLGRRDFMDRIDSSWPADRLEALFTLLRRGHPDPIHASFALDLPSGYGDGLLDLLAQSASRSTVLRLDVYHEAACVIRGGPYHVREPPPLHDWLTVSDVLCRPTPLLRFFSLIIRDSSNIDYSLDAPEVPAVARVPLDPYIFGGEQGQLRVCRLSGIGLPLGGCWALSTLRTLDYRPVNQKLRSTELIDILRHMPQLEILGLTLSQFEDDVEWSDFKHRSLSKISTRICRNFLEIVTRTFPLFTHLSVHVLHISSTYMDQSAWLDAGVAGLFGQPEALRLALLDGPRVVFDLTAGRFQLWRTFFGPPTDLSEIPTALLTRLESLTVHESLWDIDRPPPPAPTLKSLRIIFRHRTSWDQTPSASACAGIFNGAAKAPWICAALRDVVFSFSEPDVQSTISLADIVTFLRTAIHFDSPRLRSVQLHGATAIAGPDPAAAFILLQAIAENVEAFEECSPDAAELFEFYYGFFQSPASVFDSEIRDNL